MVNVSMHSTQRMHDSSRSTPLRVVASVVLALLALLSAGLIYCYLTTPVPAPRGDTMIYPRLPMHPF